VGAAERGNHQPPVSVGRELRQSRRGLGVGGAAGERGDHQSRDDRLQSRRLGREGIEVTARINFVWTFHDGAVTKIVSLNDFEDALEAAGLRE
jgi:hypothetical protein